MNDDQPATDLPTTLIVGPEDAAEVEALLLPLLQRWYRSGRDAGVASQHDGPGELVVQSVTLDAEGLMVWSDQMVGTQVRQAIEAARFALSDEFARGDYSGGAVEVTVTVGHRTWKNDPTHPDTEGEDQ